MRNTLFLVLFLAPLSVVTGCSHAPAPRENSGPPATFFAAQSFFDVVDGRVWLEERDLPMLSQVRQEILRLEKAGSTGVTDFSRFLPEIFGADREFVLVPENGGKNASSRKVKIVSAKYIAIRDGDQSGHEAQYRDCTGYPWKAWVIQLDNDLPGKNRKSGTLFPKGSKFFKDPSHELPEAFAKYRSTYVDFIQKTYGDAFPDYGKSIDEATFAVRSPDGFLYFFGPNPAINDANYRAYRFDEKLKVLSPITLPTRITCAT